MIKLLLVCLDEETYMSLLKCLSPKEYIIFSAKSYKKAKEILSYKDCDAVIVGHKLLRNNSLDFIRDILKKDFLPIIVISRQPDIRDAIEAIKNGACDFLVSPLKPLEIKKALIQALKSKKIVKKNICLNMLHENKFMNLIGISPGMQRVKEQIVQVAPTKSTVLITGESGTGKELIAESIYSLSLRVGKPFIKINCGALPEYLLESELFGHEKGAFTGALFKHKGRFELAHGGTIFLDEVSEMPSPMQIKLLRVLETGEFENVGGENTIKVDVRVIAATNKNLEEEVKIGRFRADLYYRLNVFSIEVPPLRERYEDILILAHNFLESFCKENGKDIKGFSHEVETIFLSYSWPGNVRELKNVIERAVIISKSHYIQVQDLPPKFNTVNSSFHTFTIPLGLKMKQIEEIVIRKTLAFTKGNKLATAKMLGISLATLYRHLK